MIRSLLNIECNQGLDYKWESEIKMPPTWILRVIKPPSNLLWRNLPPLRKAFLSWGQYIPVHNETWQRCWLKSKIGRYCLFLAQNKYLISLLLPNQLSNNSSYILFGSHLKIAQFSCIHVVRIVPQLDPKFLLEMNTPIFVCSIPLFDIATLAH